MTSPDTWSRRAWVLAAIGVAAVLLTANTRLLTGRAVPIWDADHQFASWYSLVADFARTGQLLIWNPWTNGGSPDFADPQFGAFSPLTVGFGFVAGGSLAAFHAYWLMIWLAGGLGMLVLARHLDAPAWGGFAIAVGWLFSGFMTGHAQHTPFLIAFSALPWIIWRLDVGLLRNRLLPAVQSGVLLGLAALAGYPGMVMAAGGYVVMWSLGRTLVGGVESRAAAATPGGCQTVKPSTLAGSLVLLFLTAAIVASPTYVAFLVEGQGYSDRAGALPRDVAVGSNALDPGALATFSSSLLSTLQWRSDLWSATDISSSSIYTGVMASWLALFAVMSRPTRRWYWWLVATAIAGLAVAVGPALPFRGWLYDLVPPSRYFRHAAIFRSYLIFSLLVLALYGTRELRMMIQGATSGAGNGIRERHWQTLILSALVVGAGAGLAYWRVAAPRIGTAGILITLAPWLTALIVAVAARRFQNVAFAVPALLVAVVIVDAFITVRAASFTIATEHPQALAAWQWVDENRSRRLTLNSLDRIAYLPIANGHTNKHLGVKTAVLSAYTPNENRAHVAWTRDTVLGPAALGRQRIWFAAEVGTPVVPPTRAGFSSFRKRAETLGSMPAVVHGRDRMLRPDAMLRPPTGDVPSAGNSSIDAAPAAEPLPYTLLSYEPSTLALRITARERGYVIVTDRWARGWHAQVDGAETPVLGANFIFRAVPVEAGTHDIVMRYEPYGFPALLVLSWGTIALTLIVSIRTRQARDPRSTYAPGIQPGEASPHAFTPVRTP